MGTPDLGRQGLEDEIGGGERADHAEREEDQLQPRHAACERDIAGLDATILSVISYPADLPDVARYGLPVHGQYLRGAMLR